MSCCVDSGPKTVQLEAVRLVGKMLLEVAVAGAARWRGFERCESSRNTRNLGLGSQGEADGAQMIFSNVQKGKHCLAYVSQQLNRACTQKQPENDSSPSHMHAFLPLGILPMPVWLSKHSYFSLHPIDQVHLGLTVFLPPLAFSTCPYTTVVPQDQRRLKTCCKERSTLKKNGTDSGWWMKDQSGFPFKHRRSSFAHVFTIYS